MSALALVQHHGVARRFIGWIVEHVSFADGHEQAITRPHPVHLAAGRHVQRAFQQPDILHHASACRVRREGHLGMGRKLHLHDINIGTFKGRGDGASDIAGIRILPCRLVLPFDERRGGAFILRKEAGQRKPECRADTCQKRGRRAGFRPFYPRNHRPADAGCGGELVQRQISLLAQMPDALRNGQLDVIVIFHYVRI